ncbi:uncharacterized protein METZ01_LOCUS492917, partial [marine metagenome]
MSLLVIGCETVTTVIVPVHTVRLSPSSLTLEEGENGTISVTMLGGEGDRLSGSGRVVAWSTKAPFATVSGNATSGTVTALSAGETEVTVDAEGVTGRATLIVTRAPILDVNPTSLSFETMRSSNPNSQSIVVENVGGG